MPKHKLIVTEKREERLPDWAASFVVIVGRMKQKGLLDKVAEQLRVPRQGGYSDVDIVVFLLCFLCSGLNSQKELGRRSAAHKKQIAALADRKKLPAPSSVSRYLGVTVFEDVQPFVDELLLSQAEGELFRDERTAYRDRWGEPLWAFDWDPTVLTVRKRGLPDKETLPEAKRRAGQAEAGYGGRKRGELQFTRSIIEQGGSAQPVGLRVQPGNGQLAELIDHAVGTVKKAVARAGIGRERAFMRVDGLGGCVPFISAAQEAEVSFLCRFARYNWLEFPEIEERIKEGEWQEVDDSGSGPTRYAMDLGWYAIRAGNAVKKSDGSSYEPVRVRVVISRFEPTGRKKSAGAGKFIDGWQYEMYVTDLLAERWPASDLVWLYYGRAGCENHYAQMEREQGINRLFCCEPSGQLLVTALALWLFGEQAEWGFEIDEDSAPQIKQPAPKLPARTPPLSAPVPTIAPTTDSADQTPLKPDEPPSILAEERANQALQSKGLESPWRWDAATQAYICPAEEALTARRVRGSSLIFAPEKSACQNCAFRIGGTAEGPRCTPSTRLDFRKELWIMLLTEEIAQFDRKTVRKGRTTPQKQSAFESLHFAEVEVGPLDVQPPRMSSAGCRRLFRHACQDIEVEVVVTSTGDPGLPPRTAAEVRQRRRQSWKYRHERGALRNATVTSTLRGGPGLRRLSQTLDSDGNDSYLVESTI